MNNVMPQWDGFSITIKGSSHDKTGKPCQDASHFIHIAPGFSFLIVADGAGSSTHGQIGSKGAINAIVEYLQRKLKKWRPEGETAWRTLLLDCFRYARETMKMLAIKNNVDIRQLSTTLSIIALSPEGVAAAGIGDSAGLIGTKTNELILIDPPEHGNYANETYFLSQSSWENNFHFAFHNTIPKLAMVFSDSLEHIALCRGIPYEPFIEDTMNYVVRWKPGQRTINYRNLIIKEIKGILADDDISIVIAWNKEDYS